MLALILQYTNRQIAGFSIYKHLTMKAINLFTVLGIAQILIAACTFPLLAVYSFPLWLLCGGGTAMIFASFLYIIYKARN